MDLEERLIAMAPKIHATTQPFLVVLAEFDRVRGWERSGHTSCAHWLARYCAFDLGTAREKVRAARALAKLPLIREAMGRGELSFSQVRCLTRAATPDDQAELLQLAGECSVTQLERVIRAWKKGSRRDELEWERVRFESRRLSIYPDDDGMYQLHACLTPEVGALLMRVIEAACGALFREHRTLEAWCTLDQEETRRQAAQRRADALGLMAERAMAAGFGSLAADESSGEPAPQGAPAAAKLATDAGDGARQMGGASGEPIGVSRGRTEVPISGSRADRYQVFLHVDTGTLRENGETGRSDLEDGTRVSYETSRRLSCDAGVVRVAHRSDGSVLDVGRKTRTIPPALRRALEVRDRGCRFPGCGLRFTDAHHVRHWADGGETSLDNCLLLCRHHHRLVHECGWTIGFDRDRRPLFFDPRGGLHYEGRREADEQTAERAERFL